MKNHKYTTLSRESCILFLYFRYLDVLRPLYLWRPQSEYWNELDKKKSLISHFFSKTHSYHFNIRSNYLTGKPISDIPIFEHKSDILCWCRCLLCVVFNLWSLIDCSWWGSWWIPISLYFHGFLRRFDASFLGFGHFLWSWHCDK